MRALIALTKKELWEIFGDRSSRRGGLIQGLIITAVLGGVFPYGNAAAWVAGSLGPLLYFAVMPGIPAAVLAADAIAGERERRTLATLLATPVRESTILFGKWFAALSFGLLVGLLSLVLGYVVVASTVGAAFVPSARFVLGAIAATMASSSLMASISVLVSLKTASARGAQQIASILSMVMIFGGVRAGLALGLVPTWPLLFGVAFGMIVLSEILLTIGTAFFRRERLLEP
jgi:ABC-2 type transport system permease protein